MKRWEARHRKDRHHALPASRPSASESNARFAMPVSHVSEDNSCIRSTDVGIGSDKVGHNLVLPASNAHAVIVRVLEFPQQGIPQWLRTFQQHWSSFLRLGVLLSSLWRPRHDWDSWVSFSKCPLNCINSLNCCLNDVGARSVPGPGQSPPENDGGEAKAGGRTPAKVAACERCGEALRLHGDSASPVLVGRVPVPRPDCLFSSWYPIFTS